MSMEPYSQWGEDKWILANLKVPDKGIFVDVGAADGIGGSNTLMFEERGWAGLLIEPNSRFHASLKANRGRQKIANYAIHNSDNSEATFHHDSDPFLSGLARTEYNQDEKIPAMKLGWVLWKNDIKSIDLLSIDTEGTELDVWSSLGNFPKPSIVIVEWNTVGLPDRSDEILKRFTDDGYNMAHKTPGNFIFQKKDLA